MLQQDLNLDLPNVIISEFDERRLSALATASSLTGDSGNAARALLAELERAEILEDGRVPSYIVRMYSRVEFEIDSGPRRKVELVYPDEADIDRGKISVLTPIGAALIGLAPGHAMTLLGHDGRQHKLRIFAVKPPAMPKP